MTLSVPVCNCASMCGCHALQLVRRALLPAVPRRRVHQPLRLTVQAWNAPARAPLAQGMRVRIKAISMSEARARQSVSAGWADGMRDEQLGKAGVVVLVDSDGDVHVRVDGTTASLAWSPQLLEAAELRPASAFREVRAHA